MAWDVSIFILFLSLAFMDNSTPLEKDTILWDTAKVALDFFIFDFIVLTNVSNGIFLTFGFL